MKRRLPPFAAVKAFEAAARHSSIQMAADELSISASAVSHQVKSLEDFIGSSLFDRQNNLNMQRVQLCNTHDGIILDVFSH